MKTNFGKVFGGLLLLLFASVAQSWGAPTVIAQPLRSQVVIGFSPVDFSVVAQGSGALSYQWLHNGLPVSGATGSKLNLQSVEYSDRGFYQVRIADSTGVTISQAGFLNVLFGNQVRVWHVGNTVTTPLGPSNVTAVSAGDYGNLALKSDGSVVAWAYGEEPDDVPAGLADVVAISSGFFNVALKSDGTVVAWGKNNRSQKAVFSGLSDIVAVSGQVALKSDGTLVSWNFEGDEPLALPAGLSDVIAISTGGSGALFHGLALKSDGTVIAWGNNDGGQSDVPPGLSGVIAISADIAHSLVFKSDGRVVGWGNTDDDHQVPEGLMGVVAISAGDVHALALKSNGEVKDWLTLNPGVPSYLRAFAPNGINGVFAIDSGAGHSVLLQSTPLVTTTPATNVHFDSASLNAEVNALGLPVYLYFEFRSGGFVYPTYGPGNLTQPAAVSAKAPGLLPGTTYYYRVVAQNVHKRDYGVDEVFRTYGEDQAFTTPLASPELTTLTMMEDSTASATVSGSINPNGQATSAYFEYQTSSGAIVQGAAQELGAGTTPVTVTQTLGALQSGATYRFRLVAINASGPRYSAYTTFSSASAALPTIIRAEVSEIFPSAATLSAQVNPNGSAATVYFEYGLTTSYGARGAVQNIGAGRNEVISSAAITNFVALHLIHFRAVATNANGISYGEDQTFTSSAAPPIFSTPFSVRSSSSDVVIRGSCNPNGFATKVRIEAPGFSNQYFPVTADQEIGSGSESVPISFTVYLSHAFYTYRVVATSSQGQTIIGLGSMLLDRAVDDLATGVTGPIRIDVLANDSSLDRFKLAISSVTQGIVGTVSINSDLSLQYSPGPGFSGSDTFTYTIRDGFDRFSTATVTIIGNVAVTALAIDDLATNVTGPVRIDVLANDGRFNGYTPAISSVTQGVRGTVLINFDLTLQYSPGPNFNGSDTFTYTIPNGSGGYSTATVTILGHVITPALAVDDLATNLTGPVRIDVLANDSHFDGYTRAISSVTQGVRGTVLINADLTLQYSPGPGFNGSDTFTYTIPNGSGGFSTATVTILGHVITPALAVDDLATNLSGPVRIDVLANDSYFNGYTRAISSVTQGALGTVSINSDLSIQYSPGPNFSDSDTFTYTIPDGLGGFSTATVKIRGDATVTPIAYPSTYVGVALSNPALHETGAYLRATVTKAGAFTGRLQYAGYSFAVKGPLSRGNVIAQIQLPGQPALYVDFGSGGEGETAIKVMIYHATGEAAPPVVEFEAHRSPYSKTNPWDLPGRYTATLPLETNSSDPALPQTSGYAAITINRLGVARVVGKLGDGTPISMEGPVDGTRQLPFYTGLYGKKSSLKGSIFGLIAFQTIANVPQCLGLLYWHKPPQAADPLYPAGFTTMLKLAGGPYALSAPAIALSSAQPNADFTVSGASLASDISKQLSVSPSYRVSIMNAAADRLALRVFPKTGLFSGSFRDANGRRSFGGVILQGENIGTGLFRGENKTGAVLLKPRPTQP